MATRDEVNGSLFVFAMDTVTGRPRRMAIPFDAQIGTVDNPAELQLHGRLALNTTTYIATSINPIKVSPHDTIVNVKSSGTTSVVVHLPASPQDGELHYVVDAGRTSTTVPIYVLSSAGHTISGESVQLINSSGASLSVYWNSDEREWTLLSVSSGGGGGGGGSGDVSATYVLLSATGSLPNARVLQVGNGLIATDTGPGGSVTLTNVRPGDLGASYVVMGTTASLSNERALVPGDGIVLGDGGPGGNVTVYNSRPGDLGASYIVVGVTASLSNERQLAQGTGIRFLDGGANNDFTVFIDNNVVATVSGTRFTGPVVAAGGLSASLQRLPSGQAFLAASSGTLITTSSTGQVIIAVDPAYVADPGASYVVLGATSSLSNERVLTMGTDLSMSSTPTAVTLYNNYGFDRGIPVPVIYLTGSLNQQRVISQGPGISITDFGPGNALQIALEQFTSQSTHAFHGYCTGSLAFTSTNWADVSSAFLGSFVNVVQNHITRVGSTFTVSRDGLYYLSTRFNANISSGSHIALRISGTAGSLLQHTSWQPAGSGQPDAALNGILSLTSGSSFVVQYATSGSGFEWPTPGLVGGPVPDVEGARTGDVSVFLITDPIVVSQSYVTNNNTVTGSGWITACDINFAASSSTTVVDGTGNVIGGISWRGVNVSAGSSQFANVPGDGLRIDPNATSTDNGLTSNTAPQVRFRFDQIIPEWNLDDVELRVWVQFNTSGSFTTLNAGQIELARSNWANDGQNYSWRSRRYGDGAQNLRDVSALLGNSQAFSQTHAQDHNIIVMHMRNMRHCDFYSSFYNGGHLQPNNVVWPHVSSTFFRGQGDIGQAAGLAPTMLTGSGDLSFVWSAYTQNTANNYTASMQRLKVEYRRGVGTGGGGSGGIVTGSNGGGGDPDAAYLVAQTTGSLTQQRLVVAGPGITISDGGPNGLFAISASSFTPDADLYASYLVIANTSSLPNERMLVVGNGLTMSDGGPNSSSMIINTRPGDLGASYVVMGTTASLSNERVLTAGTNVTITDNGPNSTVVIAAPGTGADIDAQYIVFSLTSSLPNERRLVAGTGISLTDGGVGGNLTISTNADTTFADVSASYVVLALTTSLPNERRLVAGSGIQITDGGANGNVTVASTIQTGADPGAAFVLIGTTASLPNERALTAGPGITVTDNGANNTVVVSLTTAPADASASYVVLNTTSTLANERVLTAGYGVTFTDTGPGGLLTVSVATGSVAPPSASYVVMSLTGALPNERVLTAGPGIAITDNGANNTVVIQTDGTGNGDRAATYVVMSTTSSLDNERALTAGSGITITDNGPGSTVVISSTGGSGGSRFPDPEAFFIYSGIKTINQMIWQAIGAFEFTPDGVNSMAPSGSTAYQAFFQPIVEVYPSGTLGAARLYNIGTATAVANSAVTGSSMSPQALRSTNLSGSLLSGSNLYEMQIMVSASVTTPAYVICKGAKLNVVWL